MTESSVLRRGNPLEVALADVKAGSIPFEQFIRTLLANDIVVLSGSEVAQDGSGLAPLLFEKDGSSMVAIFSSLDRTNNFKNRAPYALRIQAVTFMRGLARTLGIVLNPGSADGLEISPEGVVGILRDFGAQPR